MKYILLLCILATTNVSAQPLRDFTFKSPAFNGNGYSAHILTIENQEHSRKKAIEDALEAARKAAERDADNTTMAKFIRNLESRIYSQMSKQLVESMFSNDNAATFGSFTLEGNVVTYETLTQASGEDVIQLRIVDEYGTETLIEIPVGTGNFAQDPDIDA